MRAILLLICVHATTAGLGRGMPPTALAGSDGGWRETLIGRGLGAVGRDPGSPRPAGGAAGAGRGSGAASSSRVLVLPWGFAASGRTMPHRLTLRGGKWGGGPQVSGDEDEEDDSVQMARKKASMRGMDMDLQGLEAGLRGRGATDVSFTMGGMEDVDEEEEARPAAERHLAQEKKAEKEADRANKIEEWGAGVEYDPAEEEGGDIWLIGGRKHEVSFFGCKSARRWNDTNKEWDDMPTLTYERINCGAVQLGRKLYVAGGWHTTLTAMRNVEVLDLDNASNIAAGQDGVWNFSVPMAKNRSAFGMAVLDGTIYACGGWDEEGKTRRSMEKWRPGMKKWEKCASMKLERNHLGFAALGGRLVAAGGQDEKNFMHNTVEVYDPVRDSWTMLPHMMQHLRMCFPLVPFQGKLWAIGGFDHQGPPDVPADFKDPDTGEEIQPGWYAKKHIPKEFNIPENATKAHDLLILENLDEPYVGKSVEFFDPKILEWVELEGCLQSSRAESHGCVYNGTLVTFGGLNDDGGFNNEPFIYDIEEAEKFPHLKEPVFQNTAEILDIANGTWRIFDQMELEDPYGDFALIQVR